MTDKKHAIPLPTKGSGTPHTGSTPRPTRKVDPDVETSPPLEREMPSKQQQDSSIGVRGPNAGEMGQTGHQRGKG